MFDITIGELIPVLQTAIGPVILISGIGLLLLTMTNRFARVIDRLRLVTLQLVDTEEHDRAPIREQLRILMRQAKTNRRAIALSSTSVLFAAILIIVLFFTALLRVQSAWIIGILFICCMLSLIGSLIEFIRDINQSLAAIRLEIRDAEK